MGRLVCTHSTYVEGLIPWLEVLAKDPEIQTITPGVISKVRGHSSGLQLRVSIPVIGGFKMLARMAGTDSQLSESLLMHKLQGLEATYGGDDFPDEAKEAGAKRVWAELEKVLMKRDSQKNGHL